MNRRIFTRTGRWSVLAVAAVAAAVILMTAAPALAAPPANTISEQDLQTLLEAGTVHGYFSTVLGGVTQLSQTPVPIPVTVLSIVPNAGPAGDLILFQASGDDIANIGGIAAGMSGSPLYIDDGSGTDKLAGAVSYGDVFTTHELGLATPIADMTALESTYASTLAAPTSARLAAPVATSGGKISTVLVAPSRAAAARLGRAAAGAVMAPLTTLQVNGLIPDSAVYKKLAAKLTAHGFDLTPRSAGAYQGTESLPALDDASSLGVMYSMGDFAAGALGTVTYVDHDNQVVVAFGHPFDYAGATALYLTSAWVQGIWSSSMEPYKVMSPVATVGTITQDRGAGVVGLLGPAPDEVQITSQATLGSVTKTSASTATQWVVDNPMLGGLPSAAASVAMQRVTDTGFFPGSAKATVKIDVSDATGDYHVLRTDVWADPYDVTYLATSDIDNALATLTSNLPGLSPKVTKIDFQATLTSAMKTATIEDVTSAGPFKNGANHLTVELLAGDGTAVEVPVTLDVPVGVRPEGMVEVYPSASGSGGFGTAGGMAAAVRHALRPDGAAPSAYAPTLADVVDAINSMPTNTQLEVSFTSVDGAQIGMTVDTQDWVVDGYASKQASRMVVHAPSVVKYGHRVTLSGMITSVDGDSTVRIYKRVSGTTVDKLVATVPVSAVDQSGGPGVFGASLAAFRKTARVTIVWDGDGSHFGATWKKLIRVVK